MDHASPGSRVITPKKKREEAYNDALLVGEDRQVDRAREVVLRELCGRSHVHDLQTMGGVMRSVMRNSGSPVGWSALHRAGGGFLVDGPHCIARLGQHLLIAVLDQAAAIYLVNVGVDARCTDYLAVRLPSLPEPPLRRHNRNVLSFLPLFRAHWRGSGS